MNLAYQHNINKQLKLEDRYMRASKTLNEITHNYITSSESFRELSRANKTIHEIMPYLTKYRISNLPIREYNYMLNFKLFHKLFSSYLISTPIQEYASLYSHIKLVDCPETRDIDVESDTMELILALESQRLLDVRVYEYDEQCSVYVDSNMRIDKMSLEMINDDMGDIPMFIKPVMWRKKQNNSGGYLNNKNTLLMGNKMAHHNEDMHVESTNILQSNKWHIDYDVLHAYNEMKITVEDKYLKADIEKMLDIYQHDAFYYTWGMCLRGRNYPRAYGLNPNGTKEQKAMVSFGNQTNITSNAQAMDDLRMDIAGHFGMDKHTWSERLQYFYDEIEPLLKSTWKMTVRSKAFKEFISKHKDDAYTIGISQIINYQKAMRNELQNGKCYLDFTANGTQILSMMTNDIYGMRLSNVVPNIDNKRMNTYKILASDMSSITGYKYTTEDFKIPAMTVLYGSVAEPKKAFTKKGELSAFYKTMNKHLEGAMLALELLKDAWQPYVDYHEFTMPNGRIVRLTNIETLTDEIDLEIDGEETIIEYSYKQIMGAKKGISLPANVTHAIDAWIKDMVIERMSKKYGKKIHTNHDCFVSKIEDKSKLKECIDFALVFAYEWQDNNGRFLLENIIWQLSGKEIDCQISSKNNSALIKKNEYAAC